MSFVKSKSCELSLHSSELRKLVMGLLLAIVVNKAHELKLTNGQKTNVQRGHTRLGCSHASCMRLCGSSFF